MCDPATLALGLMGILGSKPQKPPAAAIPATAVQDAQEETGAEVILGGDRDVDAVEDAKIKTTTSKKTSGSGLNTNAKATGISIL